MMIFGNGHHVYVDFNLKGQLEVAHRLYFRFTVRIAIYNLVTFMFAYIH